MPEPLWIYLMALLYCTNITPCSAIADAFDSVSHDRLTRMLQGSWSGHTLLDLALRTLFAVAGGYLIVDDTVVDKPYARVLGEAAWVWSSKHNKVVFGVSVVLLVWTDGQVRIPLAFRCWHKGGSSKGDLALELLSYARNRLRCKPQFVLFDSWYPSKKLLQRIRDYGWYFVCQLKKNRRFEGAPLARSLLATVLARHRPVGRGAEGICGAIPPQVLRNQPAEPERQGGPCSLQKAASGGGGHPDSQKPSESGGLSSRLQAVENSHATAQGGRPGASCSTFKGVWSTVVNFARLPLPDTRLGPYPRPYKG